MVKLSPHVILSGVSEANGVEGSPAGEATPYVILSGVSEANGVEGSPATRPPHVILSERSEPKDPPLVDKRRDPRGIPRLRRLRRLRSG